MAGRLKAEIKQGKPFTSLEEEVLLNIQRTADMFTRTITERLKPAGISPTQYNVLRILRGAGDEGLSCSEIAERMVTKDPDITRLLDRLEDRELVTRTRQQQDRRVITVRITSAGLDILTGLDDMVSALNGELLGHLGKKRLKTLIELLEAARLSSS
ncbi:MAG: MarR family transcriptional regulator [Acidobacteriota bacterium]